METRERRVEVNILYAAQSYLGIVPQRFGERSSVRFDGYPHHRRGTIESPQCFRFARVRVPAADEGAQTVPLARG